MNRARRPPLEHPLASGFARAIDSFSAALGPESIRYYQGLRATSSVISAPITPK
jgi:hypothetical protein